MPCAEAVPAPAKAVPPSCWVVFWCLVCDVSQPRKRLPYLRRAHACWQPLPVCVDSVRRQLGLMVPLADSCHAGVLPQLGSRMCNLSDRCCCDTRPRLSRFASFEGDDVARMWHRQPEFIPCCAPVLLADWSLGWLSQIGLHGMHSQADAVTVYMAWPALALRYHCAGHLRPRCWSLLCNSHLIT